MDENYPKVGQGPWKEASTEDIEKDEIGFTNPNLHRRVDSETPAEGSGKYRPDDYEVGIYSVNSYRLTESYYHSEDAEDNEIP